MNRFMRLPEGERWLIVEASYYLLCAKLATLATPARTLLALGSLDPATPTPAHRLASLPAEIAAAVKALDKTSYNRPFDNCLVRAVALRMLLARRDIPTDLHIGARKDERGHFAAHAWLTYQGTILVGGDEDTRLYRELVGSSHDLLQ